MKNPYRTFSKFSKILSLTGSHTLRLKKLEATNGWPLPHSLLHPTMFEWAQRVLEVLRVKVTVLGDPSSTQPCLYVGNHVSYLDIPLLMSVAPLVFVAKKQIGDWPFFGNGCRRVGTVFVERDSSTSRKDAMDAVGRAILERQQSVVIFPSGTTTVNEARPWRWGAFQISAKYGIPIKPFRLTYTPLRKTAFIDEDLFPFHLWTLLNQEITARIEFHPEVPTTDPENEAMRWWNWTKELVGDAIETGEVT